MKILLVEDDRSNLTLLQEMLELLYPHVSIYSALNGLEALKIVEKETIDLIFTDIDMPEMNGIELIKAIRNDYRLDIPVVCITAFAIKGDKENLMEHGFSGYLSKPIRLPAFEAIIEEYLN